jgi:hypothetical protein
MALTALLAYTAGLVNEKLSSRRAPDGSMLPPLSNGVHPSNENKPSNQVQPSNGAESTPSQWWTNNEQDTVTNGDLESVDTRDNYVHSPET